MKDKGGPRVRPQSFQGGMTGPLVVFTLYMKKSQHIFQQNERWPPKSISSGARYVTPDSTIYCRKAKMCRFSAPNCFSHQIRAACRGW
jgi:hypothetical protein